jgi:hypothetical protein
MSKKSASLKTAIDDVTAEARTALDDVLAAATDTDDARVQAAAVVELGKIGDRLAALAKRLAKKK